ncbi:MAG: hypothetical protein HKO81_04030 [Flavobacteriaceae bacterium]|nr:hypothetical protein [Bacteroidia bacterium]NNL15794.1 hypothetical protein [Flavobacteriaceae bacterium]
MKNKIILILFLASISLLAAQNKPNQNYPSKVGSIDSTIKTLYSVISGDKDLERNWDLFKYLFKEDAEIILNIKNPDNLKHKNYLSIEEFIRSYGKWLETNGFFAKEMDRTISTYQHLNHVSSTYEYYNFDDNGSFTGVNSINLLKENNRWYISNLKWNQEVNDFKIIKEYLPVSED